MFANILAYIHIYIYYHEQFIGDINLYSLGTPATVAPILQKGVVCDPPEGGNFLAAVQFMSGTATPSGNHQNGGGCQGTWKKTVFFVPSDAEFGTLDPVFCLKFGDFNMIHHPLSRQQTPGFPNFGDFTTLVGQMLWHLVTRR